MKIKTTSINRKILIITSIGFVIIASGVTYALTREQNKMTTDQNNKTSSVKEEQVNKDKPSTDASALPDESSLPPKTPSETTDSHAISDQKSNIATPTNPPEKPALARASQKDGNIKIVATLQSSSPGYCEARLTKPGQKTISREAKIIVGPSYYVCDFMIPVSALSAKGEWNVTVIHHIGKAMTESDKLTVGIE